MPTTSKPVHDPEAERVDAVLAARAEFNLGFKRSQRNNLWRHYELLTVTVFRREEGTYGWCIAGPNDKRFSKYSYDDEAEALSSVASELGIGEW